MWHWLEPFPQYFDHVLDHKRLAESAYKRIYDEGQKLYPTHPVRLETSYSYAQFMKDECGDKHKACSILSCALEAIDENGTLDRAIQHLAIAKKIFSTLELWMWESLWN